MVFIRTIAVLFVAFGALGANATTISLYTLPQGNTILQISGALSGDTAGGVATSATRTLYFFAPDFGDAQDNLHDYTGANWPYVYLSGPLKIDDGISADVSVANDGFGDFLLINGNPLYLFINDNTPTDANGNFGPWFFIRPDGTPTQSTVVPLPAALPLLLCGLLSLGVAGRRKKP